MLKARFVRPTCLLVAGCCFSSVAYAQGFHIFAMGSGSYLYNEKFFTVNGGKYRSNYATGGKITFGAEVPWKFLGIEGAYGIGRNNLRVANLGTTPPSESGYGVRAQRYSGNAVLRSPVKLAGLQPYLSGGLEYARFGPTSQAKTRAFTQGFAGQSATLGASNQLGVNIGGGVEWHFFPTLALRLDLRNHTTGTPTYGLPKQSTTTAIFPVSGKANDLELSAGITFHVGR